MAVAAITIDSALDAEAVTKSRSRAVRMGVKRSLDVVASLLVLALLAPVFFLVAAAVLVLEGRPVFFAQTRVGRHGRPFRMYKFRTMTVDAEDRKSTLAATNERGGPLFKVSHDPRVTTIGRVLRRTSLDELPQFLNVLLGSMSVVGPRPALPEEVEHFSPDLRQREELPQGITGLWQIKGRTDGDFDTYACLDQQYVRDWSLRFDLAILLRTPFAVVRQALEARAVLPSQVPSPAVTTAAEGERPFGVPAGARLSDVTIDLRDPSIDIVELTFDLGQRGDDVIDLRDPPVDVSRLALALEHGEFVFSDRTPSESDQMALEFSSPIDVGAAGRV